MRVRNGNIFLSEILNLQAADSFLRSGLPFGVLPGLLPVPSGMKAGLYADTNESLEGKSQSVEIRRCEMYDGYSGGERENSRYLLLPDLICYKIVMRIK